MERNEDVGRVGICSEIKGKSIKSFIKLLIESQCVQYSREKFGNLNESRG